MCALGWGVGAGGWVGVGGGWRCHSTGRMLKNVIRESVMSNLQQSHHQAGVEVDASTSTPCKLQFSPCGRKKNVSRELIDWFIFQMDFSCIDSLVCLHMCSQVWLSINGLTGGSLEEHEGTLKKTPLACLL